MSPPLPPRRLGLVGLALLSFVCLGLIVHGQSGAGTSSAAGSNPLLSAAATPASPSAAARAAGLRDEPSPAELLEAYHSVRDQLRATQAALLSQRAEADERARAQTQALNERLEALKASLAIVNQRQQEDASRAEYELFRQQELAQRSTRLSLWIAASVGVAVLLGTLLTAHFQRRAMNRIAEAVSQHPHLLAQANAGWLPLDASVRGDQAISQANQRLATTLERIEQRIQDLEHTTQPTPVIRIDPAPRRD